MRATVEKLNLSPGRRVLVISDVHAMVGHLEGVLKQAEYRPETDKLILLGDMVEKGPESLKFLRYLMEFRRGKDVTFLRGNCDHLVLETAYGLWPAEVGWRYMSLRPESVLWQMGREMEFVPRGPEEMKKFGEGLKKRFKPELDFIASWPVIGETEEAVFVHGGIDRDEHMEKLDAHGCMKNDNFMRASPRLRRWCVVGHTPTALYREEHPCSDPIWDKEKKILSIDGGCAIKPDGQLNCVIFPKWGEERMEWVAYDGLETVKALEFQAPSEESRNIHWGVNRVEVLEARGDTRRCRQVSTGYEMDIPADFLFEWEGTLLTQDITDYRLPAQPGDTLKIVKETTRGLLAKKDGETGWYFGKYEKTGRPEK